MLAIKYVERQTIALVVQGELFYIKQGPGTPCVYDHNLRRQIIPNIDHWLQARTHQRYSYRGVCDMAGAFAAGLRHSYNDEDVKQICEELIDAAIKAIFCTDHARSFAKTYWVELLDPNKLQPFMRKLRDNFDKFRAKYNDDELYEILCRLWQFSNYHAPSEAAVFEAFMRKELGRAPQIPRFPEAPKQELLRELMKNSVLKGIGQYKGIPSEMISNVRKIQSES